MKEEPFFYSKSIAEVFHPGEKLPLFLSKYQIVHLKSHFFYPSFPESCVILQQN